MHPSFWLRAGAVLLALLLAGAGHAAERRWAGGFGPDWSQAGNWGGTGTEIDWSGALDYIKIGFTTGNVGGATLEDYELSVDDIYLSEGPLF